MTKSLRGRLATDHTLNLLTRLLSNSSLVVRSPPVHVLIKPLRGSGSSTQPLSSLSCSLSITFKPMCTVFAQFLLELSMLVVVFSRLFEHISLLGLHRTPFFVTVCACSLHGARLSPRPMTHHCVHQRFQSHNLGS